jgi:hypothetical protein
MMRSAYIAEETAAPPAYGAFPLWMLYAAMATATGMIFPPVLILFAAPFLVAIALCAPKAKPVNAAFARRLMYAGVLLLALWPVYLNFKLGPLPILTPPRAVIYVFTALWLYDMAVSPIRRARLVRTLKRSWLITAPVAAFFAVSAAGAPFAQGKVVAIAEFLRQSAIWLLPFLAALTYLRRQSHLLTVLKLIAIAGAVSGLIALLELASGKLLATALSPLIGDGQWLDLAQQQKIRDGVFRAQAGHTHPLSLGEFLGFAAPLAFGFLFQARRLVAQLFWGASSLLVIGGVFATSSRAALLCVGLSLILSMTFLVAKSLRRPRGAFYRPAAGLLAIMFIAATPLAAGGTYNLLVGATGEQAARSSQGRADQIEQALPKILARPATGYGSGRAAVVLGFWGNTLTIDNYYLTLALDLGLGGPPIFLTMLFGLGVASVKLARAAPRCSAPLMGLAFAALTFALTRSILSMTGNISILYFVLAAAGGAYAHRRTRKTPTL